MAARKKTKSKKKQLKQKKAVARKKAAVKKKTVSKKKAVKKKKAAVKKRQQLKSSGKKTQQQAPARGKGATAQGSPARGKSAGKSKNIGRKVKVRTGKWVGEQGILVRQDGYLGTYFLTLDSYKSDPVYSRLEWGPYFESQLEFLKK